MNSLPKVSIITSVYNAEKYLNECILSILRQNYTNFEYIIIDGGSTDNTVNIIKQHADRLTYWISEPDEGIYDAWNKGLTIAKGDWIAFVGADDLLYPDALQIYIDHITQHPRHHELEFVSSRIELVKQDLSSIRVVGEAWEWKRFQHKMITWHVGCFHSRNLFSKYGYFDSSYKVSGDYEFLMRPRDKLITSFINRVTVKMRTGGVSSVRIFKAHDETYRAKIRNEILSAWVGYPLIIIHKLYLSIKFTLLPKSKQI